MRGVITRVNTKVRELLGYDTSELIGREIEVLVPDHLKEKHLKERTHYYIEPIPRPMLRNLNLTARRRDGTDVPVEISLSPLETPDGKWIISVIHDLSDRIQLEQARRESEERYRSLVDLSPEAIVVHAMGEIVYVNEAAVQLLNRDSRSEVIGKSFLDFVPQAYVEEVKRRIQTLPHPGQRREPMLVKTTRRNGQECFLEAISGGVQYGGKPAAQVILRDITDRIKADEELKGSREQLRNLSIYLQSARESERASLAREIHDELGGFLTAIKLDLALFEDALEKPDIRQIQDEVRQKLESIGSLVDDTVKSMRRIITELRPVLLDSLGLSPAIEWLAEDFQRRTGITCSVAMNEGGHVPDGERSTAVYRIVQETLTNVARHAQATHVDVNLSCEGGQLILTVSDNGKGIEEERVQNARSFGLLGMRERALLFGGTVNVKGSAGRGTKVEVQIPLT
jgi:PAS domain S-box-containing protein